MSRQSWLAPMVACVVAASAPHLAYAEDAAPPAADAQGAAAGEGIRQSSPAATDGGRQHGFANVLGGKKGSKLPCPVNSPDEVEMLLALRERHTVLLARETQLAQREAMLKHFEAALASRLAHVEVALAKVESSLSLGEAGQKDREARLQVLADTVAKLSAKKAAPMLAQAEPSLVAELFRRLGPMRASALLAVMPPAKAGKLIDSAAQHDATAGDGTHAAAGGTP